LRFAIIVDIISENPHMTLHVFLARLERLTILFAGFIFFTFYFIRTIRPFIRPIRLSES